MLPELFQYKEQDGYLLLIQRSDQRLGVVAEAIFE
jgi:hypothetical protein